ncbi:orotidine-5'-phosphate decarboxylase [Crassaminicella thermophila]|uniref:Orotidine 5'-phosphate decarboxylase n=1 Tax=Crassaminicella thermophila TaxID=2599308 RepID=A0A5C0SHM8_CRATE|nr:orotidine-5'-phosphate decarboxylase [Crassaminicella thermophila]QEK13187.1 orotidine-5'-phosphate decarboxylase [Crassaminicella thermophila]
MFIDELVKAIKEKRSNVVVGLDPRIESIPEVVKGRYFNQYGKTLKAVAEAILEFNKEIIDNVCDVVAAVKPQIAFYEQYGLEGLDAYIKTCKYAKEKGLLIIGDIKRGDIGTTSKAYANAHLGNVDIEGVEHETFAVDSITVNPYLGGDTLEEFIEDINEFGKGMFVLVKTSNPGSGQLQDLVVEGKRIYEVVAEMVDNLSQKTLGTCGYSSVGAVVAATYPEQAKTLRKSMPKSYFLVPGYGAQGASADDIVDCFNEDGLGAVINSSRGIIFAYKKSEKGYTQEKYGEAARKEALDMRDAINKALESNGKCYW